MSYDVSFLDAPSWAKAAPRTLHDFSKAMEAWQASLDLLGRRVKEASCDGYEEAYRQQRAKVSAEYDLWFHTYNGKY